MPAAPNRLDDAITAAYLAGDMEHVIALASASCADRRMNETGLLWLGLAQQATGRYAASGDHVRRLTRLRPEVSAYWNNLALACRQCGDLTASEQALMTARSLAPDDAEVHYNLGLLYIHQRRWLLARESLMDAVQPSPHFIEARLQAAYACHVCGDNDSAAGDAGGRRRLAGPTGRTGADPGRDAVRPG